ncbi:pseudouridine synthase [Pullulanibacillus sp. KACC 23026]|uniref:pseudouridine synthase n=1 Tax=Pullulanibacillus sp. KACC 23026 TaxID=3028315 RepID=UPI0023AFC8FB|nr:pseudouridine synthase [Pullulanibacillus sp. KACC 23026]WEG13853.1 pseudouridine synthase [Pullulanibacillus sp. KACC 23026]
MRLDKWLSHCGGGTRRDVKLLLKAGRVKVNDKVEKQSARQVHPEKDSVTLDGVPMLYQEFVYFMLNKPSGVITATEDSHQKTVLDLFDQQDLHKDLFPVGRLDKDTEGLLLITNDGALGHLLLSPKHHVKKTYEAIINASIQSDMIEQFAAGIELVGDGRTKPASLRVLKNEEKPLVEIVITEGKFHQIKRMFHAVGREVVYLKRTKMGPLSLDPSLALGEYRRLTETEREQLLQIKKD